MSTAFTLFSPILPTSLQVKPENMKASQLKTLSA